MVELVWDTADPASETKPEQVVKARHESFEAAFGQAEHDLARGVRVLRIQGLDGSVLWTPPGA